MRNQSGVAGNVAWNFLDGLTQKTVAFLLFLLLARILSPREIGVTGIITAIFVITRVVLYAGFHTALIQRKEIDEIETGTVFFTVLAISLLILCGFFAFAPVWGFVFRSEQITQILRIMPLVFLLGPFDIVNETTVARNLWFRKSFFANLAAALVQSVTLFACLRQGFTLWGWVYALMARQVGYTLFLSMLIRFVPKLFFSCKRFLALWRFGSKVFVGLLMDTVFVNLQKLAIGISSPNTISGYYNQAALLPETVQTTINQMLLSAAYPLLCAAQDDTENSCVLLTRMIGLCSYVLFPVMFGLAAAAEPLVRVLLTEKWLPCVPYIRILALTLSLYPLGTIVTLGVQSIGRSDVGLKLEMAKKAVVAAALVFSLPFGILAVLWGGLLANSILTVFLLVFSCRFFEMDSKKLFGIVGQNLLIAAIMGACVFFAGRLPWRALDKLILQILGGGTLYLLLSVVGKVQSFGWIREIVYTNLPFKHK